MIFSTQKSLYNIIYSKTFGFTLPACGVNASFLIRFSLGYYERWESSWNTKKHKCVAACVLGCLYSWLEKKFVFATFPWQHSRLQTIVETQISFDTLEREVFRIWQRNLLWVSVLVFTFDESEFTWLWLYYVCICES